MATLFENMWHGDVPALTVMKNEPAGVMAILANPQETLGQLVVFPRRAVRTIEDLTWTEHDTLMVASHALAKHIRSRLPKVERVVRHVEGYGVEDHAHVVVLPSYHRGDSDRIHHPSSRLPQEDFENQFAALQRQLDFPEDMFEAELAARNAWNKALLEDAT